MPNALNEIAEALKAEPKGLDAGLPSHSPTNKPPSMPIWRIASRIVGGLVGTRFFAGRWAPVTYSEVASVVAVHFGLADRSSPNR